MIASMSEGLVSLAVDQFVPPVLPRTNSDVQTLGAWELAAQVQLGSVNLRNPDSGLRVTGQAISETQMNVIDTLCEHAAQATKIQR